MGPPREGHGCLRRMKQTANTTSRVRLHQRRRVTMNRIGMTAAATAIAYLVMATGAQAQGADQREGEGRGRGPGRGVGMMLPVRDLSLTDAQREQVAQIRAANRDGVSQAQK